MSGSFSSRLVANNKGDAEMAAVVSDAFLRKDLLDSLFFIFRSQYKLGCIPSPTKIVILCAIRNVFF
jgi:hypothetical protein